MNFGINIDAGNILAELKSSYASFKETKVFNEDEYKKLLTQYSEAIKATELLKSRIEGFYE